MKNMCVVCNKKAIPEERFLTCSEECFNNAESGVKSSESRSVYGQLRMNYPQHWDAFQNMYHAKRYEAKEVSEKFNRDFNGFKNFINILGNVPKVDRPCRSRINHLSGYEPGNIIWTSWKDNNRERNKRVNGGNLSSFTASDQLVIVITKMMELQDSLNKRINTNWKQSNNPWYRATFIESSELMDHTQWRWWKKGKDDIPQQQLELVDIFHFILSWCLQREIKPDNLAALINQFDNWYHNYSEQVSYLETIENLVFSSVSEYLYGTIENFVYCCNHIDFSIEGIYYQYVCKNVLNTFRQNHGYKEGTYIKDEWGPEGNLEDNQFLEMIMQHDAQICPIYQLPEFVMEQLEKEYARMREVA